MKKLHHRDKAEKRQRNAKYRVQQIIYCLIQLISLFVFSVLPLSYLCGELFLTLSLGGLPCLILASINIFRTEIAQLKANGLYKAERAIETPQKPKHQGSAA